MLEAVLLALLIAKIDSTQAAAIGSVILAAAALFRALTIDPRASRLAERKENADLRSEVDELYRGKRDAEDRERAALRRLDTQDLHIARITGELDRATARIEELSGQVKHWRMIAGELRGGRDE